MLSPSSITDWNLNILMDFFKNKEYHNLKYKIQRELKSQSQTKILKYNSRRK